jgi:hypothetical protein
MSDAVFDATVELGFLDPTDPSWWADPYPSLAKAREKHTLARSTIADFEVLRYAEVEAMLKDRRLETAIAEMVTSNDITSGPLYEFWQCLSRIPIS